MSEQSDTPRKENMTEQDTTRLDLKMICGSTQHGNLVNWFLPSPTGGASDSLTVTVTYRGKSTKQVFNIRKFVHDISHNPECPKLTSENLAWVLSEDR